MVFTPEDFNVICSYSLNVHSPKRYSAFSVIHGDQVRRFPQSLCFTTEKVSGYIGSGVFSSPVELMVFTPEDFNVICSYSLNVHSPTGNSAATFVVILLFPVVCTCIIRIPLVYHREIQRLHRQRRFSSPVEFMVLTPEDSNVICSYSLNVSTPVEFMVLTPEDSNVICSYSLNVSSLVEFMVLTPEDSNVICSYSLNVSSPVEFMVLTPEDSNVICSYSLNVHFTNEKFSGYLRSDVIVSSCMHMHHSSSLNVYPTAVGRPATNELVW